MVSDNAHTGGVTVVGLMAENFKLADNRPQQADLKHIRVTEFGSGDALQARAMVDVRLFKRHELTVSYFLIRHEDIVADFHEPAAVAVRVAVLAEFRIVRCAEIVE